MQRFLECGRFRFPLGAAHDKPLVMGILNVTPDSFSDGGSYATLDAIISRAEQMVGEGADLIDIGGESSRPGAEPVSVEEELKRVIPVVYALQGLNVPLSVDTTKPVVMREAIAAGADMINDINGFRAEGAIEAVTDKLCALCIMHMQNQPLTMQAAPQYDDPVAEVTDFLRERVYVMTRAGISRGRMAIDPGFGFGKTMEHNLLLLDSVDWIQEALDLPLLAGLSRKSMIGTITGKPVDQRQAGSLAAALYAAAKGAKILRVHDVGATVDALKVWRAATTSTTK
ncbi:MAG TPA: dihydropteroate synthase [Burkholderiaceae bacterium]